MRRLIHRAASHRSLMAMESLAASPRRTRVTSTVMRRKVTSGSGSKSGGKTTSQEQVLESLHRSQCIAGSSPEGGHHKSHKKSTKRGQKYRKSHKKSLQ